MDRAWILELYCFSCVKIERCWMLYSEGRQRDLSCLVLSRFFMRSSRFAPLVASRCTLQCAKPWCLWLRWLELDLQPLIADIINGLNTIVVMIDKRRSPVHLVASSSIRPASISANLVHLSLSDVIVVIDPLLNVLLLCKVHPWYVQDWLTSDNRLWLLHLDQVFLFVEFIGSHAIDASSSLFTTIII